MADLIKGVTMQLELGFLYLAVWVMMQIGKAWARQIIGLPD
jgi:uncharacterized membrane protein YhdT